MLLLQYKVTLQSGALAVPFAALPRTSLRFAPQLQTFKVPNCHCFANVFLCDYPIGLPIGIVNHYHLHIVIVTNLTCKASPLAVRLFCKDCGAFVGMDYQVHLVNIAIHGHVKIMKMMMVLTKRMMTTMMLMLTMQEEHTVWVSLGSLPTLPENWTITEARSVWSGGQVTR